MNRRVFAVVAAVAAIIFSVDSAFAGSPSTQFVRIKNVGSNPVAVYAANGSPTAAQVKAGAKIIPPKGIAQFILRQGNAVGIAVDPSVPTPVAAILPFTFPRSRFVYLVARASGGTAGINFAAPRNTV